MRQCSPFRWGASWGDTGHRSRNRHRLHGVLIVTRAMAVELGLRFEDTARATLADGSETTSPYYGVAVLWDGRTRYVEADAADPTPLVGMRGAISRTVDACDP